MRKKVTPLIKLKWKGEVLAYLLVELLLSRFSLYTVYRLGEFLGSIVYRFSSKYRGIVRRNLMMSLGNDGLVPPDDSLVEEAFTRNGGNLLTTVSAGRMNATELYNHLEVEGEDVIEKALESSGAIVMLAHMGNWEILTKLTDYLKADTPFGALYRPLNNPIMNDLILQRRKEAGMELISARRPIKKIQELIQKKGVMCILSDQKIGNKGTVTSFFGRPTPCTRLPILLHEMNGVPLFTVAMITTEPGKWKLSISPVNNPTQQGAMDALSLAMSQSLPDCFWFQDRWQETPHGYIFPQENEYESTHYAHKPLPGIIESRTLLTEYPELFKALPEEYYPLSFWDEGAVPDMCYYAVGNGKSFKEACNKVGLKKASISPERLLRAVNSRK